MRSVSRSATETGADAEIDALVAARDAARAAQATSPRPTASGTSCAAQGVTLEDTPTGTIWHRS